MKTVYPETVIDVIIADIRGSNTYGIRTKGDVHNKTSGEWSVPIISADQIREEADIPEVDENIETLEDEIDGQVLQFESVEFHVLSTEGRIEFLNAVDSKFSGEYADIIEELVEDFIKTGEIYRFHGVSASYAAEARSNFTNTSFLAKNQITILLIYDLV